MAGLSRRALCSGLVAMPVAAGIGRVPGASAGPAARTTAGVGVPDLIRRVVEVVAQHEGVSPHAIMTRKGGPEVLAASRKALFLALSLSQRPSEEVGRYLGVENSFFVLALMRRGAAEVEQDPMGVETILDLAWRVHTDAPAMLLGDIPAYDLEAGYRAPSWLETAFPPRWSSRIGRPRKVDWREFYENGDTKNCVRRNGGGSGSDGVRPSCRGASGHGA